MLHTTNFRIIFCIFFFIFVYRMSQKNEDMDY